MKIIKNPAFLVALFAAIATVVLLVASAANSFISVETSNVTSPAEIKTDTTASNGSFIAFQQEQIGVRECTVFGSTSGNDSRSGNSLQQAVKTPAKAVSLARSGDVVCFASGTYPKLEIINKKASAAEPIIFRALDFDQDKPYFQGGDITRDIAGINIKDSTYVYVDSLAAKTTLRGIYVDSSQHIKIENCLVHGTGQEGIHIGRGQDKAGTQSSNVVIRGCEVYNTGNRKGSDTSQNLAYSVFGEQVYVGTGSGGGDTANNVLIENNHLHDNSPATSEAVNIKSGTYDITVRNNHIHDIDSWCEGAIRVNSSARLTVVGNVIHDIVATGRGGSGNACSDAVGIRFASPNATIEDNIIWNAKKFGIFAENGSSGAVSHNTIINSGLIDFRKDSGIASSNNIASDGSNGVAKNANDFVGPLSGNADAGDGPGSGYVLKNPDGNGSRKY